MDNLPEKSCEELTLIAVGTAVFISLGWLLRAIDKKI